ncbi:hypothetical protein [Nitratireductor sp. GCM10026969]|uniref:aromatic-ring hydroxylase C-terminal domain-containing protein n=1 Tax=Nitratireductor sp. GCM10026969 TaxID=3252645 RepID=UPI00361D928B
MGKSREADRRKFEACASFPAIGMVQTPAAGLTRPDGHVAWVGDGTTKGLADALFTWFGPPTSA